MATIAHGLSAAATFSFQTTVSSRPRRELDGGERNVHRAVDYSQFDFVAACAAQMSFDLHFAIFGSDCAETPVNGTIPVRNFLTPARQQREMRYGVADVIVYLLGGNVRGSIFETLRGFSLLKIQGPPYPKNPSTRVGGGQPSVSLSKLMLVPARNKRGCLKSSA
jgi:hypothetical protein